MVDLTLRVLEALTAKETPAACPHNPLYDTVPPDAKVFGFLPDHLRRLYVLKETLEKEHTEERHRRCVEFFGREEYDNERIEFMVWNEVNADPKFNGAPAINHLIELGVGYHFPEVMVNRWGRPVYKIGPAWEVYWEEPKVVSPKTEFVKALEEGEEEDKKETFLLVKKKGGVA